MIFPSRAIDIWGDPANPASQPSPSPTDNAHGHDGSMSAPEPSERASQEGAQARSPASRAQADGRRRSNMDARHTGRPLTGAARRIPDSTGTETTGVEVKHRELPFAHMRVHFEDFASQLRLHRHHEHRRRMLTHRRHRLQNALALSARLKRVSSWVHDGLVEISQQADAIGFTRLHQHTHDLMDICLSQWTHEVHALDTTYNQKAPVKQSFLTQLPPSSQQDCLEFIQTLRNNPRFLVERLKALSPAQISSLSSSPKFQELSESVLTSLSQNRGRASVKKRVKAYSRDLEEYASSFERSNPLSFLLHNIYGPFQDVQSPESDLRFATWSTICSTLMLESEQAFEAILGQVLNAFAGMYQWQIKERLELFLMGVLQRGAFLIDMLENSLSSPRPSLGFLDTFNTPQAKEFFNSAVRELFEILACDGGIPTGALQLGRAIIGKLPTVEVQSQFRGHLLFQWFLQRYLRTTIVYPEDEKMLLQFHINEKARSHLLYKLWDCAFSQANDVFNPVPVQPVDPVVQKCVHAIIYTLEADEHCFDPYQRPQARNAHPTPGCRPSLSLCAADIAHVLEALSPQYIHTSSPWDSFLSSSHSTFRMQYSYASSKFNDLRRRILEVMEPGHSSKNSHPCQETWAQISISPAGLLTMAGPNWSLEVKPSMSDLGDLHLAEKAAVRLVEGRTHAEDRLSLGLVPVPSSKEPTLAEMFAAEARQAHTKTDRVAALYWHDALAFLYQHFPLTVLTGDDTKVLGPMTERLKACRLQLEHDSRQIEQEVAELEALYDYAKMKISDLSAWLDKLRVKLWYKMDVVSSSAYEDAKNISTALNNMALSTLRGYIPSQRGPMSPGSSRPATSDTSASSLFDQPRVDTLDILKAPAEHGGPRKLSDPQIDLIKKWLERNHIDNFCKGEERIHRFCMEVKIATKKLVGESLSDSPVLWSSELFSREGNLYDIHAGTTFSVQPSTRAPSVWSEPLSSSSYPSRTGFVGSRASFFSQSSSRVGRDLFGSDLSSLISSPGRAATVTTLESSSSFWSPPQSIPRSVTSASSQSRPASMFEDQGMNRLADFNVEKANFLDRVQQDLTCLLLSDLGCPVWSCGSETDAWMETMRHTPIIVERLEQRAVMARLHLNMDTRCSPPAGSREAKCKPRRRSQSAAPNPRQAASHAAGDAEPSTASPLPEDPQDGGVSYPYHSAFLDILSRMQEHVDPNLKLKAIRDFEILAQAFLKSRQESLQERDLCGKEQSPGSEDHRRRRSLNPSLLSANLGRRKEKQILEARSPPSSESTVDGNDENSLLALLKKLLFALQPKTIFRDLQYIAAFASSQTLADSDTGRAFLHVGLAALAWKDEVCRCMVDVADRIVVKDSIKREEARRKVNEPSILKAMEYWVIAAREGNAIAQRELASLYLTHPDILPIVSLPLAFSSEIFKAEMMWEEEQEQPGLASGSASSGQSSQSLCLALHWMQQAASNGDTVAQSKLKERQAIRSMHSNG
ncbi:hypothetical protein, variant 2 [Exophiala dermatitidis NIH/UT8656]|uniref:Uncharacterized protein n=1 Tax=Exophiala dermatitidis (strain ATCC 34100 / CBS 525.76 / NIH/UT8656) TaxID=858893 RepID=H6BW41_EXODN|nr:hypothetical protein, variant 2 [Exophiala dermatitidis NIH/UT8656]EHY55138.1 hypothetical protein, variant 2 [Exophiala dermatitidis NIH/UT8656]